MFKNAIVYRIAHWDEPTLPALEERLATLRFVECGASQPESAGFFSRVKDFSDGLGSRPASS